MTRFDPSLLVRRLVVIKGGKSVYDERFHSGVNVIRGTNSSGKSTILNFIYYGLGGDLTDWSAAAVLCSQVMIEVSLNGHVVTLARSVSQEGGAPMDIFGGELEESILAPVGLWKRYPYRRSQSMESFSQAIFRLLGIPEVATDISGNVTVHQILRLLYTDQLSPVEDIFRFERFDQKNLRDTVGRLLCGAFTSALYDNEQLIRKYRKEFDAIHAQLRSLFVLLGKAEQKLVSADWVEAERKSLESDKNSLEQEIFKVERHVYASAMQDEVSLKLQEQAYEEVKRLQTRIAELKKDRDSLILTMSDSRAFINSLTQKMNALNDSASISRLLGDVKFHSCPACYSILDSEEEALDYLCHLCKTPFNSEQISGRIAALVNETALQIKQSDILQQKRSERLQLVTAELSAAEQLWVNASRRYSDFQKAPSTEAQQNLRELQRKVGYIDRMIEDLDQKSRMMSVVAELSQRKDLLDAEIVALETMNESLRQEQESRLRDAYVKISSEIKDLLHKDLRRQDSFESAKNVSFTFGDNRLSVDGESYFSASSRAILKSSFFLGFIAAAGKNEYFRHPRFCMIDALENMGVEAIRSQNFQRQIARISSELKVQHQIIYATAMIDPALDDSTYTIGRYSTRDEPTLAF